MNKLEMQNLLEALPHQVTEDPRVSRFFVMLADALCGAEIPYLAAAAAVKAEVSTLHQLALAVLAGLDGQAVNIPVGLLQVIDGTHVTVQVAGKASRPRPLNPDNEGAPVTVLPSWILVLNLTRLALEAAGPEAYSEILARVSAGQAKILVAP